MRSGNAKHRALLVAFVQLVLLGLTVLAYSVAMERSAERVSYIDYFSFHATARQADRGWDPYAPVTVVQFDPDTSTMNARHPNLNPPVFIAAMIPLSRLSTAQGYMIFMYITLGLGLCAVPFLLTAMPRETSRTRAAIDVILLLALSHTVFLNISLGQLGHAFLLPVAVTWWALRTNRDRLAGVALGVAVALKVFFGLFFVMLLIARRWRAAAIMVVVAAGVSALGTISLGWDSFIGYRETLAAVDWYTAPWNASLLGSLMRLFVWTGLGDLPGAVTAGAILWGMIAGLVFVGFAVLVHRHAASGTPEAWDAIFGVTLTAMLVLSPLSWVYYLPFLIIPLIIGMRSKNPTVRGLVAASWLLCAIPFHQAPLGEVSTLVILTFQGGFAGWGVLASTAAMFIVARDAQDAAAKAAPPLTVAALQVGKGSARLALGVLRLNPQWSRSRS